MCNPKSCARRVVCIRRRLWLCLHTVAYSRGRFVICNSSMGVQSAISLLVVVATVGTVVAQTTYPVLNITKGAPLPTLQTLQPDASGWITLSMLPATIQVFASAEGHTYVCSSHLRLPSMQGPGDNTSADDPYIMYTGRTYNEALIAGMIRIEQGALSFDCNLVLALTAAWWVTTIQCSKETAGPVQAASIHKA